MILEKTLRFLVIGGVFALPFVCLIIAQSLFFPYITGKNFAFRIIVEVITGAWLALALIYPKYRPRRSWILGAFALFVFLIAISDALGANPFKSFWSNYERMDGWVTLAHLLAYLTVAASVVSGERLWRWLWQVSLTISMFLSVYGLLQVAGVLALGQGGVAGLGARVDATFGNPIYLAAYMLFHIFIAALLWAQMRNERPKNQRTWFSVWYGSAIILDTLTLLLTGTRGTTLGLIGGAVLALLIFAFFQKSRTVRLVAAASIAGIIILGGGVWLARDTTFVHSVGFLDRLATISTSDSTVKARFLNAGIAWEGVKERPIFGWGQENYAIVFDKYYDPRMYAQEPWFDRVHDIIFDWLIAGGFVGLIAYLSIFGATLWALWRGSAFSLAERSILTGLLAGYFFHNLFVFDNITSYILFATLLAYIVWRSTDSAHMPVVLERKFLSEKALPIVAALAALLVWGSAWYVNASALAQNRELLSGLVPSPSGNVMNNLEAFKRAIAYGTYGTQEAREQLAQGAARVAASQLDIPTKQAFFDAATQQMKLQSQDSPLDARFPLFLGVVYDAYGDWADGAAALEKAHQLSPKKQSIIFEQASNADSRGDSTGALNLLTEAFNLEPSFSQARILYAATLIRAGQDTLADQILAPLVASGEATDPRIVAQYIARKQFGKLITIAEAHVKAQPQDLQGYITLAAAYYGSGNSAKAITVLEQAEAISPASKDQLEQLIQQVRDGTVQLQ